MRIRNILILTFLIATLVPSVIFGWWSYEQGVKREFSEVKDRHLLLAENLGRALDRYNIDLVAAFETITGSMLAKQEVPNLSLLMRRLNMDRVLIVNRSSGKVLSQVDIDQKAQPKQISETKLKNLRSLGFQGWTSFSGVMEGSGGKNVIFAVRRYQGKLAIGEIDTRYFVELGKSISFGKKGHAAIVDQYGTILAHPLPSWVAARKSIAKVSAVKRMMNGETGIQQFYSPALKGDMIAGFTTVKRSGWGVMIPQPVEEIYEKVYQNNKSILAALGIGLSLSFAFAWMLISSLAAPLETLATAMNRNAKKRKLSQTGIRSSLLPIKELVDFHNNYNDMVINVSEASKQLELAAYHDTVTGLPNRARFQQMVCEALNPELDDTGQTAEKDLACGILVLIDLDNFKEINDTHGHDVGDEFLRACASKLLAVSQRVEVFTDDSKQAIIPSVARIGGDEFTILVPGLVGDVKINVFLDSLRRELSEPTPEMVYISECSASIGCARYPEDGMVFDELIKRADIAMYHAKKRGKNRATIYSKEIGSLTSAEIRRDVLVAIDEDQLFLEYQPKICTKRKVISGVEALVRWNHPTLGRLPPDLWLPAISNSPVIGKLGEWVLDQAMRDHRKWCKAGHDIGLSVNIGSKHFIAPEFVYRLKETTRRNGFKAELLDIEVTEDAIFASEERAAGVLNQLHDLGYSISIDDFGKGYSNIARLAKLPVDYIKIDRSLVVGALENDRTQKIMASTISMADALGCKTVAEGAETLEQAEFVTNMGANMIQGYYFARPMGHKELLEWLDKPANDQVQTYQEALQTAFG